MNIRLDEQQYKNTYRILWHGSKFDNIDQTKSYWGLVFVTYNFEYALKYCRTQDGRFGYMMKCHLADKLNIFNIRSQYDNKKLTNYLLKLNSNMPDSFISDLTNNGWLRVGVNERNFLFNVLKKLGYDGFFNYECHEYLGEDIYPSIGLFDESNLIIEKTLNEDDIINYINIELKDKKERTTKKLLSGNPYVNYNLFSVKELEDIFSKKKSLKEYYENEKHIIEKLESEITKDKSCWGDYIRIKSMRKAFNLFEEEYLSGKLNKDIKDIYK